MPVSTTQKTNSKSSPRTTKAKTPATKQRAVASVKKTAPPAARAKKIVKIVTLRPAPKLIEINPQLDLAHGIVEAISDKLGERIVMMDLRQQSPFTDYFVICSANSERQIKAISDGISEYTLKHFSTKPRHIEGTADSGWMLLDYSGITVHVFSQTQRQFYQLEDLWKEAPVVLKMQ
jgi:ribosome-associated protein